MSDDPWLDGAQAAAHASAGLLEPRLADTPVTDAHLVVYAGRARLHLGAAPHHLRRIETELDGRPRDGHGRGAPRGSLRGSRRGSCRRS
ncbi:hypothetical protein AMK13_38420 [Streptomyces sp. CB02056]|nr:hypothetical protein AMK13_38420 [Streptomyces sp. CB02056]